MRLECYFAICFILFSISNSAYGQETGTVGRIGVMPCPQIENYGQDTIYLSTTDKPLKLSTLNFKHLYSKPFQKGVDLLSKRLKYLGQANIKVSRSVKNSQILVHHCSERELQTIIRNKGIQKKLDRKRLSQAYFLKVKASKEQRQIISIKASSDLGVYYAFVTLCQLVNNDEMSHLIVPEVEIVDWPEIGLRLGKASASDNTLMALNKFYKWMSLYKVNLVGLQFHGEESRELGAFRYNINAICPEQEKHGLLETIVYFCPFRGKGYNLSSSADLLEYEKIIHWVFEKGADGFEIDYNDWPDEQFRLPSEDVVNLVYNKIIEQKADAYVLYCPPNRGPATYNRAASNELIRILSNIPSDVWPIWTGMKSLLDYKLTNEDIANWINATERKPFFWLNRVSIGADLSLARAVDGDTNRLILPGGSTQGRIPHHLDGDTNKLVLPGERLPKDLSRYFQGIHLNYPFGVQMQYENRKGYKFPIPKHISSKELIYFATVADFIWNPQNGKHKIHSKGLKGLSK